jgi:hypothetical protein
MIIDNSNNSENPTYGSSEENNELVELITKTLSTPRKFINANYTKDSFAKIKSDYPDLWKKVEGKTVYYKTVSGEFKKISFTEKNYTPLIYNDIIVSTKYVWKNVNVHVLIENTNNKSSLKDIIKVCADNKLSGVQLIDVAKLAFPDEYKKLKEIRKKCKHNREALYCYYHDIEPIICNGKHLQFQTLSVGYSYQALAEFANKHDEKNLHEFITELNKIDYCSMTYFVEHYFPSIHSKIVKEYPAKTKPESYHLFMYEKDKPDECLFCNKPCEFKTLNTGYRDFCSERCRWTYTGLSNRKHRDPEKWAEYKFLVEYYTTISYRLHRNVINPDNLPRGLKKFHIDHVLPKIYGFEHDIDPQKMSHFKNLQMLTSVENKKKNAKIEDERVIDIVLNLTDEDLKYFEPYDKKILSRNDSRRVEGIREENGMEYNPLQQS